MMKIGASHHIFVSLRKRSNSFNKLIFPMIKQQHIAGDGWCQPSLSIYP